MWRFTIKATGEGREAELALRWELEGDPLTDDFTRDEITATELWDRWARSYAKPSMPILWFIEGASAGIFEGAPLLGSDRDFLSYYTWPENEHGRPLRWTELPVGDKLWDEEHGDKGGFVQSATGWKPSPLQVTADIALIARAARLPGPR